MLWLCIASWDINGSPKLVRREHLHAMRLTSKDWFLDAELMIKAHALGIRVHELNVFARQRGSGLSHVRGSTCWEFFRNLLAYRFSGRLRTAPRKRRVEQLPCFRDSHGNGLLHPGSIMIAQPVDRPALRKRQHCRACDSTELEKFLELGPMPLANAFLRSVEEFSAEAKYPLDVYFCPECSLVQLLDVVDPEVLFREYIYVSGTSNTIAAHYQTYAAAVIERLGLTAADRVIEVASNDGSLLQCFIDRGVQARRRTGQQHRPDGGRARLIRPSMHFSITPRPRRLPKIMGKHVP